MIWHYESLDVTTRFRRLTIDSCGNLVSLVARPLIRLSEIERHIQCAMIRNLCRGDRFLKHMEGKDLQDSAFDLIQI